MPHQAEAATSPGPPPSRGKPSALPPIATGAITRLAAAHAASAGVDVRPLLRRVGLGAGQIKDPHARIGAASQVAFLRLAAEALDDELLGFRLAKDFEFREIGLLYYVMASAPTLRDAFLHGGRYGAITNEGVASTCSRIGDVRVRLAYVGVARHADRHQAEFWMTGLVRIARQLTRRRLRPLGLSLIHPRCEASQRFEVFVGCPVTFEAARDELVLSAEPADEALAGADPYLHELLRGYCEEALRHRGRPSESLRTRVENAVAPLLPHGRPRVSAIAEALGMSQRTLSRRLADEGLNFGHILEEMRRDLAHHYLRDCRLPICRVAWLLGFQEVAAFSNAFRRWAGCSPTQMRESHGKG
ncbi:AraC family transcriptional regulator [Methylobacterium nigriterrae]|uniref:AraC family transcriptional regulator n=1 Tax=Methylobacterium nigriterrae TaxID=3127512 RepID=UPI0030138B2A